MEKEFIECIILHNPVLNHCSFWGTLSSYSIDFLYENKLVKTNDIDIDTIYTLNSYSTNNIQLRYEPKFIEFAKQYPMCVFRKYEVLFETKYDNYYYEDEYYLYFEGLEHSSKQLTTDIINGASYLSNCIKIIQIDRDYYECNCVEIENIGNLTFVNEKVIYDHIAFKKLSELNFVNKYEFSCSEIIINRFGELLTSSTNDESTINKFQTFLLHDTLGDVLSELEEESKYPDDRIIPFLKYNFSNYHFKIEKIKKQLRTTIPIILPRNAEWINIKPGSDLLFYLKHNNIYDLFQKSIKNNDYTIIMFNKKLMKFIQTNQNHYIHQYFKLTAIKKIYYDNDLYKIIIDNTYLNYKIIYIERAFDNYMKIQSTFNNLYLFLTYIKQIVYSNLNNIEKFTTLQILILNDKPLSERFDLINYSPISKAFQKKKQQFLCNI